MQGIVDKRQLHSVATFFHPRTTRQNAFNSAYLIHSTFFFSPALPLTLSHQFILSPRSCARAARLFSHEHEHEHEHYPYIPISSVPFQPQPSTQPSAKPSTLPSTQPSMQPSSQPSVSPSAQPSEQPSVVPTVQVSVVPPHVPCVLCSVVVGQRRNRDEDVYRSVCRVKVVHRLLTVVYWLACWLLRRIFLRPAL